MKCVCFVCCVLFTVQKYTTFFFFWAISFPTLPLKNKQTNKYKKLWESIYYNSDGELISNIRSLGFKSWQVCKDCRLAVTKRASANQRGHRLKGPRLKGFIKSLTFQQVGRSLSEGSKPAASCWQSPWLLCHPADSDQVKGKFTTFSKPYVRLGFNFIHV